MNTVPRTETPALIMAMEHLAKTISKNGGIAAVTIQEGADRLRELEARAECERLKELLRIEFASAQHALAWAERAEAALAEVEGQTSTTLLNMQQRNADLRAEVERLRSDRDCEKRLRKDADEFRENAIVRAERAEAALAIERQTLSGVIKLKMHFEAESLEQARLLGMSASREASLLGKISRLEHQLEK